MAWHKLALIGLVGAGFAVGCTVTTDDHDDEDGGLTGDDAGTGGSNGGSGGGGGGASGGGSGGGGGASGGGGGGAGGSAPVVCDPAAAANDCQECLEAKCCDEYKACAENVDCNGTGPNNENSEFICFNECMQTAAARDGGVADWADQVAECSNNCANAGSPATETEDAITCILGTTATAPDGGTAGCSTECYGVDLSNL